MNNALIHAHDTWLSLGRNLRIRNQAKPGLTHTLHLSYQTLLHLFVIILASPFVRLFLIAFLHSRMHSFTQCKRKLRANDEIYRSVPLLDCSDWRGDCTTHHVVRWLPRTCGTPAGSRPQRKHTERSWGVIGLFKDRYPLWRNRLWEPWSRQKERQANVSSLQMIMAMGICLCVYSCHFYSGVQPWLSSGEPLPTHAQVTLCSGP